MNEIEVLKFLHVYFEIICVHVVRNFWMITDNKKEKNNEMQYHIEICLCYQVMQLQL